MIQSGMIKIYNLHLDHHITKILKTKLRLCLYYHPHSTLKFTPKIPGDKVISVCDTIRRRDTTGFAVSAKEIPWYQNKEQSVKCYERVLKFCKGFCRDSLWQRIVLFDVC